MCYLRFSNCGFDEQLENRNSERKVLYSLHFTDPHPFSFSSKYQKIWHNRECREAHLTKLSLKSCWKKLGGNISWHHQVSIRSVMALKQAWTPLDKWQFQILTLVTDAAEDIKRNMPSSCVVHLLMTIVCLSEDHLHRWSSTDDAANSYVRKSRSLDHFVSHTAKVLAFLFYTKSLISLA